MAHPLAEIENLHGPKERVRDLLTREPCPQRRIKIDGVEMPYARGSHFYPCTGCEFQRTCAKNGLACNHFVSWAMRGQKPLGRERSVPTRAMFARLSNASATGRLRNED